MVFLLTCNAPVEWIGSMFILPLAALYILSEV